MLKSTAFICAVCIIIAFSCNRPTYSLQSPPVDHIVFGSGGGFTGAVTEYHLLPDGQLFMINGLQKDTTVLEPIKRKQAKKIIEQCQALNLGEQAIQQPGNIYYFIWHDTMDGTVEATWGAADYTPPVEVTDFYQELMNIVRPEETDG